MPNPQTWKATKVEWYRGHWQASRNPSEVSYGSRLITGLIAAAYERQLPEHATGVLADIGCGKAPYFGIYRHFVTQSIGVDWGDSLHISDQVDVRCDLNAGISLPDACVDTVLCTDVLEHIFDPARTWSEIARILKPGGKAIVGVPFLYWIHEAPFDYHRYTSFALRRYAERAGLEVQALESLGGLRYVLADLVCKLAGRRFHLLVNGTICMAISLFGRKHTGGDTVFPLYYVLIAAKPKPHAQNAA